MHKPKTETVLLTIIMVFMLAAMIYYGTKKEGYHVDEMYSYGLANSEYLPFMHFGESGYDVRDWMLEYGAGESPADLCRNLIKDFRLLRECGFRLKESPIYRDYLTAQKNSADTRTTTWVSGQDYVDYLAASKGSLFNYPSVYYNQRGDVHPPLYYIFLHTVSSLFRDTFSKWFALGINFAAMLLTVWLMERMISRYCGGKEPALATVLVYALSCGGLTTAVYLRMYALLTFMVVASCYVHLKLSAEDFQVKGRNRALLMFATLGGFFTHYYFVIYILAMAAVMTVWMASKKKWRELAAYLLTMVTSAAIGLAAWPFAIRHVFRGYRGQESLEVIKAADFHWIKVKVVLHYIVQQLFHGWWWIPVTAVFLLVFALLFAEKGTRPVGKILLLVLPAAVYLLVVPQIVPYYVERYFMPLFPFLCLLVVESVWLGAGRLLPSGYRRALTAVCALLLFAANNCWAHPPGYLYTGGQEMMEVPQRTSCVYVMPDGSWNESAAYSSVFARCERVAVAYQTDLDCLRETYQHKEGDCVMVLVSESLETEPVLEKVREVLRIENLRETGREEYGGVTRIYYED